MINASESGDPLPNTHFDHVLPSYDKVKQECYLRLHYDILLSSLSVL